MADLLKKLLPFQSEFSHRYACWANNHMGWAKMKKANRKWAKNKSKQIVKKEMQQELEEFYHNKEGEW